MGDGPELTVCKSLIDQFGIEEKVKVYGAVSHKEVKSVLNTTDIVVLNSRTAPNGDMERTPVTLLEVMCMWKAVVTIRHAGIPYVVSDGENGLLIDECSNEQLKEQIIRFVTNENLRLSCGKQAKETILKKFTANTMREKLLSIFDKAVAVE